MFTVYIIYSPSLNRYYVGHTCDVANRLFRHNNSGSKSTKKASDWTLNYSRQFDSRSEAMKHEIEIKAKKSRKHIESLIRMKD